VIILPRSLGAAFMLAALRTISLLLARASAASSSFVVVVVVVIVLFPLSSLTFYNHILAPQARERCARLAGRQSD